MFAWLKHAFAIDRSFSPTDEELQLAERLCREIVRRELVVPAVAFSKVTVKPWPASTSTFDPASMFDSLR